ncbi:MAG TPA: hypothetical protein VGF99_19045 [Myxococcota bacterium]
MLTLTDPTDAIDPAALTTPGGFGWWYADIVDAAGNGVVVIVGDGLPFLPGIASDARAGRPVLASSRPSINVCVYERGACSFYALQELSSSTLSSSSTTLCAGGSTISFGADSDDVGGGFTAKLDLQLPTGRCTGEIVVEGPRRRATGQLHGLGMTASSLADVVHRWAPQLGPARGHARLELDGVPFVVEGSGYHDRNSATKPLHALGIAWWVWGRAEVVVDGRPQLRIIYACWPDGRAAGAPDAFGVLVDDVGVTTVVPVTVELVQRRTWLGMRAVQRLQARTLDGASFLVAEAAALVDDGPFYLRSLWRAAVDGDVDTINGVVEVVDPHRVDRAWQRPFVRMRVTPTNPAATSLWQPLFVGRRDGRWQRQRAWLLGTR